MNKKFSLCAALVLAVSMSLKGMESRPNNVPQQAKSQDVALTKYKSIFPDFVTQEEISPEKPSSLLSYLKKAFDFATGKPSPYIENFKIDTEAIKRNATYAYCEYHGNAPKDMYNIMLKTHSDAEGIQKKYESDLKRSSISGWFFGITSGSLAVGTALSLYYSQHTNGYDAVKSIAATIGALASFKLYRISNQNYAENTKSLKGIESILANNHPDLADLFSKVESGEEVPVTPQGEYVGTANCGILNRMIAKKQDAQKTADINGLVTQQELTNVKQKFANKYATKKEFTDYVKKTDTTLGTIQKNIGEQKNIINKNALSSRTLVNAFGKEKLPNESDANTMFLTLD